MFSLFFAWTLNLNSSLRFPVVRTVGISLNYNWIGWRFDGRSRTDFVFNIVSFTHATAQFNTIRSPLENEMPKPTKQTRKHFCGVNLHFGRLYFRHSQRRYFFIIIFSFLRYWNRNTSSTATERNHLRLHNFVRRRNSIPDVPKSRGFNLHAVDICTART